MAFFMLFKVPASVSYHPFKQELEQCGHLKWFSLKPDMNDKNVQFGQMDFEEVTDREKLISLFDSYGIKYKEKPSKAPRKGGEGANTHRKEEHCKAFESTPSRYRTIVNASFHFYRSDAYGKGLENYKLPDDTARFFAIEGVRTFTLTTTYPGLLVGAGYTHPKLKQNDDDFQLGFFLDHTTGLPLISGSSIKGLIRSLFPDENDRYKEEKRAHLKEAYGLENSEALVSHLFESSEVVFYDAYISHGGKGGRIFGSDYITSHHSDQRGGGLKEPNPIKFLKVLPGVTFTFQFDATEEEVAFFKKALLDFGIGAKTNTGYGKFVV